MTDKSIIIIGPRRLQNEMMSRILEQETGASCSCGDEISGSVTSDLILIDCHDQDVKKVLAALETENKDGPLPYLIALFNLPPGKGVEEDSVMSGIVGVFHQNDPINQFLKGVKAIFTGELWFSRDMMTRFVLKKRDIFSNKAKDLLTQREIEILSLMALGAKNEDIAEQLFVSVNTIKTHIYNIFKKINVNNRLQAALWAAKNL